MITIASKCDSDFKIEMFKIIVIAFSAFTEFGYSGDQNLAVQ